MVYSQYKQQRIIYFWGKGYKSTAIVRELEGEGVRVSVSGVCRLIKKYQTTGSIARLPGSGRPPKITQEILVLVEQQMRLDDETTATQLEKLLHDKGHPLSLQTILNAREKLGWTYRGSSYCQVIRHPNKIKRLQWAQEHEQEIVNGDYDNVLWTDEASIMMECHRRFCWHKSGTQPKPKPRPKHPTKVHVWAGISCKGKTNIIIFEGKMNASGFIEILESGLIPYMKEVDYNLRFMQDNDPKHTSNRVGIWMEKNNVNWWRTPPESPDLNPIENVWHELKEYLRREIKPTIKSELIDGIQKFWETLSVEKCKKYINHLKKVVPKVIKVNGGPTGY